MRKILLLGGQPQPALDLNFMAMAGGGGLDSRVSFSRSSGATYFNSAGVLSTASSGVPRFDFNPATLAPNGLLIERASTNLLLQSNGFGTTWTTTDSSVTSAAATSPDGTADGWSLVENTSDTAHNIVQSITKAASALPYSLTVFGQKNTRTRIQLELDDGSGNGAQAIFDLSGGQVGVAAAGIGTAFTSLSSSIQNVGGGWYRCRLTATSNTATTLRCMIGLDSGSGTGGASTTYTGNSSGAYIFGAGLEQSNIPTSYIATTTLTVARVADVPSFAASIMPNWKTDAGAAFAKVIIGAVVSTGGTLFGNSGCQPFWIFNNGSSVEFWDGTTNLQFGGTVTIGAVQRLGVSWGAGSGRSITANGAAANRGAYAAGGVSGASTLYLGTDNTSDATGQVWFQRLQVYAGSRLSDSFLQNKTAASGL